MVVDDVTLEMKELAGGLVRRGRCAGTKAEIATRRLDRVEKEEMMKMRQSARRTWRKL